MNLTKQKRIRREILTADRIFGKERKEIIGYLEKTGVKSEVDLFVTRKKKSKKGLFGNLVKKKKKSKKKATNN